MAKKAIKKRSLFSFIRLNSSAIRCEACSGWDCVYSRDLLVSSCIQSWQSVSKKFIGISAALNSSKDVLLSFAMVSAISFIMTYPTLMSHSHFHAFETTPSLIFSQVSQLAFVFQCIQTFKPGPEWWVAQCQVNVQNVPNLSLWRCQSWVSLPRYPGYHFPFSILAWKQRFLIWPNQRNTCPKLRQSGSCAHLHLFSRAIHCDESLCQFSLKNWTRIEKKGSCHQPCFKRKLMLCFFYIEYMFSLRCFVSHKYSTKYYQNNLIDVEIQFLSKRFFSSTPKLT